MLNLETTEINKAYIGSNEVSKVYLGGTEVFSSRFDPSINTDLAAWWDSSENSTLILENNGVSEWQNRMSNEYHLTQNDVSAQFLTDIDTYNGVPLLYGPNGSYMETGVTRIRNTGLFCDPNEKFTVAVAAKAYESSNNNRVAFLGKDNNQGTFLLGRYNNNFLILLREGGITIADISDNRFITCLIEWDGTDAFVYFEGQKIQASVGSRSEETSENIYVGAKESGTDFNMKKDFGEIMIFDNTLSLQYKEGLKEYFQDKWGQSW